MALFSNTDAQASKPKSLFLGQVDGIQVTGTMTGYTSGSFTISAPPAGGVQATATYTAVGGVITAVAITNPGAGYTTAPTVTAAGGSGAVIAASIRPVMGDQNTAAGTNENSKIIFVDLTEAGVSTNRAKGIRIPGWTKYEEFVDAQGTKKYKVENLVAMTVTAGTAGDAEDVIAGDAALVFTAQPADATTTLGGATFTVAATGATSYQWQVRATTGGQYVNVTNTGIYSGATTATLTITGATSGDTGKKFRCQVLNSTAGSAGTSNVATLTFGT